MQAQTPTTWEPPPETVHLDFTTPSDARRVAFLDAGLAMEIEVEFLLLVRPKQDKNDKPKNPPEVKIEATLPDAGRFEVVCANPAVLADVQNVRVEQNIGRAEVVSRVRAMTAAEATAEAKRRFADFWKPAEEQATQAATRAKKDEVGAFLLERFGADKLAEMIDLETVGVKREDMPKAREQAVRTIYIFERTLQRVVPELRKALDEVAQRRPAWISPPDRERWQSAEGRVLYDALLELLECEVMDEHLKRCGMGVETNVRNYRARLESWFSALDTVIGGKVGSDPAASANVARALGNADRKRLRDALYVPLVCRFYPAADARDPNAQWFNAQRVACRGRGVGSIRVEGRLDPEAHDRTDWWILEDYNPAAVTLVVERQPGVRIEPPMNTNLGTLLRVAAAGEAACDYHFELKTISAGPKDLKVVVHETPSKVDAKFPY